VLSGELIDTEGDKNVNRNVNKSDLLIIPKKNIKALVWK